MWRTNYYQWRTTEHNKGEPVIYIGETDRELHSRVQEHLNSWKGKVPSKLTSSAFSKHRLCTPDFKNVGILNHAAQHQMRLLMESAYIQSAERREIVLISPNDASVNRNSSALLNEKWLPIVRQVCK